MTPRVTKKVATLARNFDCYWARVLAVYCDLRPGDGPLHVELGTTAERLDLLACRKRPNADSLAADLAEDAAVSGVPAEKLAEVLKVVEAAK